ncbi:recombination-associated protein RdgC [Wohlfahrtiimonas chitiniclastica]|uniref:recombination-associated protein RdgC n=1 Tax=Wohlfahrtiimonas chitiniclastica TaxID=400946 RepID=UPI001FEE06F7|nr:recombination-associated protein RdgC [Wohlfahrtiimonas chitiniclastica]
MFKNLLAYRFEENSLLSNAEILEQFEAALSAKPFTPCLTQEMESIGWITCFTDSNYVEKINNALFINLGIETKQLPDKAIKTEVEKRIEEKHLKNISKSASKELYEIVMNDLLPNALVIRSNIRAYVDLEKGWLVVDANSTKKASLLTSHLRKTLGTLPIVPLTPENSVSAALTYWALHGIESDALSTLDEIELKELKDEGGNAKFKGVALDSKEVQDPLKEGWQVTKLALEYDEQISFSLAGDFIFKRLKPLERFTENLESEDDPLLQMQAELYLAVDLYRKMITHVYDQMNSAK